MLFSWLQFVDNLLFFFFTQFLWRFADHNDVGTLGCGSDVAQSAGREEEIVAIKMLVFGQQDIQSRFDFPMLEGVVQKDDIGFFNRDPLLPKQVCNAFNAVFVHRDLNLGELFEVLQRFVAYGLVSALMVGKLEAIRFASVASAQCGNTISVLQYID